MLYNVVWIIYEITYGQVLKAKKIKVIVEKWFLSASLEATGAAIDQDFIFSGEREKWEQNSKLHVKVNLLNLHEIISLIYFHC